MTADDAVPLLAFFAAVRSIGGGGGDGSGGDGMASSPTCIESVGGVGGGGGGGGGRSLCWITPLAGLVSVSTGAEGGGGGATVGRHVVFGSAAGCATLPFGEGGTLGACPEVSVILGFLLISGGA